MHWLTTLKKINRTRGNRTERQKAGGDIYQETSHRKEIPNSSRWLKRGKWKTEVEPSVRIILVTTKGGGTKSDREATSSTPGYKGIGKQQVETVSDIEIQYPTQKDRTSSRIPKVSMNEAATERVRYRRGLYPQGRKQY
ncbi:hypothetical protein C922_05532 [Plasmodium inui San Antonio 1]|uniref:Uncharacterized protein n=1 Tax=Plasmodium inui San Antonio 1 TaxID=1237626 RepID=W6ZXV3_9APIC|nr:hypothetical protein C922_05532 [Plasmodium inui San Antonio 1]EUD64090.1 hypothetical protein C922_05532 [Plasmodium inui San Antonio 1]